MPTAGGARAGHYRARERAWLDALVARGWSVPDWPVAQGGTGWSAEQCYLWRRELALAEAPELDVVGVAWAGPAIWAWGDPTQQAHYLPAIRAGRARWCLGLVDAPAAPDTAATRILAAPDGAGYRLSGCRPLVAGVDGARWMLTLAWASGTDAHPGSGGTLFAVDLTAPGVRIQPVTLLGGLPGVGSVHLDDVVVPVAARIGAEGAGNAAIRALEARVARRVEPAAALQVLARRLVDTAAELPGDDGPLLQDAGFARALAELGVDLAGLEAFEQRALAAPDRWPDDADSDAAPADPLPLALALKLRHRGISQRIADLFVAAFGYYSLPYPDPLAIDNEGPIGHHYALLALRGMLSACAQPADADADMVLRDRLAKRLFGLVESAG